MLRALAGRAGEPTAMKRRTPLRRRKRLRARRGLGGRPRDIERVLGRFERAYGSVERVRYTKRTPCIVCGETPCDNAHVRSRAAGGTSSDVVPLCRVHHRAMHDIGYLTFQVRYGVDLVEAAAAHEARWCAWSGAREDPCGMGPDDVLSS